MIKTTPFINPCRNPKKKVLGDGVVVITHNGKTYEQVVRKKCQQKI